MMYGRCCGLTHYPILFSRSLTFTRQQQPILLQFQTPSFPPPFTQLRLRHFRLSALPDDGSGGIGGRIGGSGGFNSGGGNESDDEGVGKWFFLSWYLALLAKYPVAIKTLTNAFWLRIGDLTCQLVINQVQDLVMAFFLSLYVIVMVAQTLDECFPIIFLTIGICFIIVCIISILWIAYALRNREGASEDDIRSLPMYRFSQSNVMVMVDDNKKQLATARIGSYNQSHISELPLHPDDSECCICLCSYVDGTELYRLPCTHHFHCECISRWLRIKPTCPICKFNIRRGGNTLV